MNNLEIINGHKIFTGHEWLHDHAILVENGIIRELVPQAGVRQMDGATITEAAIIVPALIDLQVYGAGKKLFAVYPEAGSLSILAEYCLQGGTAHCLPTIATNTRQAVYKCIDAVRDYWNQGGLGILGLHLEGPWINSVKRGAHIASLVHTPTLAEVKELLAYGRGAIKMITLAPETCEADILHLVRNEGIILSAGHSDATYKQAIDGFDNGITAVTHLFNAMSPLAHRAPGLVGAAMQDDRVKASIIPDGIHVDFAAVRIAKKIMQERLFAITDAVTETSEGYYPHQLAGDKYEAGGILSGSALTMHQAFRNLVNKVGISAEEALRMCSLYPAQVMGLSGETGQIAAGCHADLLFMHNNWEIQGVKKRA